MVQRHLPPTGPYVTVVSPPQIFLRPTHVGDLCILLESEQPAENEALLQRQEALRSQHGGRVIHAVHLTCQRFEIPPGGSLRQMKHYLTAALDGTPPFLLMADGMEQIDSVFGGMYVLKWRSNPSPELRSLINKVRLGLEQSGMLPLYAISFIPELVTALESVKPYDMSKFDLNIFPHPLFTASRLRVTRIWGPDNFESLGEIVWQK
jgi:hypothetical protein